MINEKLPLLSEESIKKVTARKCKDAGIALDHAIRVVAAEGIEEPEYEVIFEIQCQTGGADGRFYTCGGQYHYDRNGILRKLYRHRSDISWPMERLDIGTDCYFYDDKGRVIRALINGTYSSDVDDDAQFYRLTYRYEPNGCDVVPSWGNLEVIGFAFGENTCIPKETIPEACDDINDFEIENEFPKNHSLSYWGVAGEQGELQVKQCDLLHSRYPFETDEPSNKPVYDYKIIKASPEQAEKLSRCFDERKLK